MCGATMPTFNNYLEYEKTKKEFFDKLYEDMGMTVISRKDCKEYDCILGYKNRRFTVEEKARMSVWGDILVETVQDTKTDKPGWIYYSKADFLVYGMFGEKTKVYRLRLKKFQEWFGLCIKHFKTKISKKGWGITENKVVPIPEIPTEIIARIK